MNVIIATMFLAFQPSFAEIVECDAVNVLPIENNNETKLPNSQILVFDKFWKENEKKK